MNLELFVFVVTFSLGGIITLLGYLALDRVFNKPK